MRYESALKVVRFLKEHMGERVSIRAICSGIELSYQPTYKHVRSLEREGVIRAAKQAREVVCEFVPSASTTLWLGLASVAERRELVATDGEAGEIVGAVANWLAEEKEPIPVAVAMRPPSPDRPSHELVVLVPDGRRREHAMARRAAERLRARVPTATVATYTVGDFCAMMQQPFERYPLLAQATVLYGEQAFWRLALGSNAADVRKEPPPAEPMVRPRRRAHRLAKPPGDQKKQPSASADRRAARPSRTRPAEDDALFID